MDVNASWALKIGDQVLTSFVATNMLNSLKMECLIASVTHFLMPGIFPETLAGDAVASSVKLLSLRKDRGRSLFVMDFARVTRTPRPGSLRLRTWTLGSKPLEKQLCTIASDASTACTRAIRQHGYVTALLGDGMIHRPVVDRVELFARGPDDECLARSWSGIGAAH